MTDTERNSTEGRGNTLHLLNSIPAEEMPKYARTNCGIKTPFWVRVAEWATSSPEMCGYCQHVLGSSKGCASCHCYNVAQILKARPLSKTEKVCRAIAISTLIATGSLVAWVEFFGGLR